MTDKDKIQIKNLVKTYSNVKVLDIKNLVIQKGEIYGLLGLNGAGKSTTMKILLSLINYDSGEINIFGEEISKHSSRDYLDKIGALIEEPSYYPNLTGYENLLVLQKMLHFEKRNINESLHTVGLFEQKDKLVKNYSLGMKQRLGIALALVKKPEFLILDEPINGLDPEGVHEIRELIKSLCRDKGMTILISSHILSEIEQMADKVGIIHKGQLVFVSEMSRIEARKWIRIKLRGNSRPQLEKLLNEKNIALIGTDNDEIKIPSLSQEQAAQLLKELVTTGGANIYDFTFQQETLEDIFLRISRG